MRLALVERARVAWMESGKGRERPLWIIVNSRKIPILTWEGAVHQSHREFRVSTPEGGFLITEKEQELVYYIAEEYSGENEVEVPLSPERKIRFSKEGQFLRLFPASEKTVIRLWFEGLPVIFHHGGGYSGPWPGRKLEVIISGEILTAKLPFPPMFPVYFYLQEGRLSLPPSFLKDNPFSYAALYFSR